MTLIKKQKAIIREEIFKLNISNIYIQDFFLYISRFPTSYYKVLILRKNFFFLKNNFQSSLIFYDSIYPTHLLGKIIIEGI